MTFTRILALAVVTVGAGLAACGDTPTAPSSVQGPQVSVAVLEGLLTRAIQDEFRAEATYEGVVADFGPVVPFVNVLTAEERHSAAIARLFSIRGLAVPASSTSAGTVPHFSSVAAACTAGAVAERENIAMYDDLLQGALPADVRTVFTNNQAASRLNHLPAFERCR
ncbi:MAG: DUF2202 domain-containing protein [Vicinamibacterales bacterium]